jgi:hypothetical protein
MLTKSELTEVLMSVKTFFPKFDVSSEVVDGWHRLFQNENPVAFRQAMDEVLKTAAYAPKPADLSSALGRSMKPTPTLFGGKDEYLARVRYYWESMKRDHERGTITVYRRHPKGFATTTKKKTNEIPAGMWSFEGEMLPRFMEPQNPDIEEDLGHGQVWRFGPRPYGLALVEKAS